MIDQNNIDELCAELGLANLSQELSHFTDRAAKENWSFLQFFEAMLESEKRGRAECRKLY